MKLEDFPYGLFDVAKRVNQKIALQGIPTHFPRKTVDTSGCLLTDSLGRGPANQVTVFIPREMFATYAAGQNMADNKLQKTVFDFVWLVSDQVRDSRWVEPSAAVRLEAVSRRQATSGSYEVIKRGSKGLETPVHPSSFRLTVLSEAALGEDWNRPEEDAAWAHLQQDQ